MALNMRRRVRVGSRQSASWRGMRGGRGSVNSLTHRTPYRLRLRILRSRPPGVSRPRVPRPCTDATNTVVLRGYEKLLHAVQLTLTGADAYGSLAAC